MATPDHSQPTDIGYWSQSPGDTSLPFPQANAERWSQQAEFIAALQAIEASARARRDGQLTGYRGFSMCRLCGIPNGSEEFVWSGYRWPAGFLHYVEAHNVRPPDVFLTAVLKSKA